MIFIGIILFLIGLSSVIDSPGFGGFFVLTFGIVFMMLPIAWRSENAKRKRY